LLFFFKKQTQLKNCKRFLSSQYHLNKFIIGSKGPLASFAEPFCIVLLSVVETVVLSLLVDKGELVLPAVVKLEAENDVDERLSVPGEADNDVVWFSWANVPPAVPIIKEKMMPANAKNIAKAYLLKFITNNRNKVVF
jgi:hypothetical protein